MNDYGKNYSTYQPTMSKFVGVFQYDDSGSQAEGSIYGDSMEDIIRKMEALSYIPGFDIVSLGRNPLVTV